MFNSLKDAQAWIESVQKFGPKYDLVRMENAAEMLGHPERKVPMVHVAGTNGKGSTVAFISHILMEAGYQTGMYISPYIESFNERFMINHVPVDDATLLSLINQMHAFSETYQRTHGEHLSFFELTTLLAFVYFNQAQVDVAVIEVGIGGRLDATNIITPEVAIITSIGYDHMAILGDTLDAIAKEKLGVVKPGIPWVSGVKDASLQPLFDEKAAQKNAPLVKTKASRFIPSMPQGFEYDGESYTLHLLGAHQIENAACAIEAARLLNQRGFTIPQSAIEKGLNQAFWPGRFEQIGPFILDGAHNKNGIDRLLESLEAYHQDQPLTIVFGVMADKDSEAMQARLEARAARMIFTHVDHPRALDANEMLKRSTHPQASVMTLEEVAGLDEPTLIAGSLYVISAMRRLIKERFRA